MKKETAPKKKSGSEKRQRQPHIDFRVTAEEKKEIEAKAEKAGVTTGDFCRAQCLGVSKVRSARRPTVEAATLSRLLAELGKIGSNLNQIAHKLNQGGWTSAAEVNRALRELQDVAKIIIEATGRKAGK